MKSDIAVMQDWMRFHSGTSPSASAYLRLCNRVLKIILPSDLRADCGSAERAIQLACILTAYFEDVISETGLFRTFTERHGELYGKALPFYDTGQEYYPDEINLYDLYFLAWHALSRWGKEDGIGIFDPFFRDGNHTEAIREIYDLFDSEFENTPQNEHMQQYLRLSPGAGAGDIRERLDFLSGKCYLHFIEHAAFTDSLAERAEQRIGEAGEANFAESVREQEMVFYDLSVNYLFNHHFSLLAQRASDELAHLTGREHPLYPLLKSLSARKTGNFLFREKKETEYIVEHISSGTRINMSKEFFTLDSEQIIPDHTCVAMGVVKWGDVWQQMGSAFLFDYSQKRETDPAGASAFDDLEKKKLLVRETEADFLQITHGRRIAFLKNAEELCDLYNRFLNIRFPKAEEVEKTKQMKAELLTDIRRTMKGKDGPVVFFINPETGVEYYFGDIIAAIADPDNAYYIPGKEYVLEILFFDSGVSREFVNYLIENSLVAFIDSEAPGMEVSVMQDNRDFLLRYYRQQNYWPEARISRKK
ncbi:MAG: DUF3843 family protein [Tannerella sp.]|jgi:hypothetical protein|nr:DUF3843 family protein [Tannerella sp.]